MRIVMLLVLALGLAGCGAAPSGSGDGTGGAPSTPAGSGGAGAASPAAATAMTGSGSAPQPGTLEALAADKVVKDLALGNTHLRVLDKQEKEWPNSGLGCEAPGMMYAMVITPGYLLQYSDGTKQYEVHTDKTGEQAVVCQNGKPVSTK